MVVPSPVIKLYETYAIFHEASGEQAIVRKGGVISLVQGPRIGGRLRFGNEARFGAIKFHG